MKLLHTADFHLRDVDDTRWQALQTVLETARQQSADAVVIAGDLFDRAADAVKLRAPLREVFEAASQPTLISPGNHDTGALQSGHYYGENVTILTRHDSYLDIGDARFFALPYEDIAAERVLDRLAWVKSNTSGDRSNVVLFHGELIDALFSRSDSGDEGDKMYMPLRLSYLQGSGIDYVLAGHFHTNFDVHRYDSGDGDGFFVYPGSPVSTTRKETGVRKVNLLEVGGQPAAAPVDTAHYQDVRVFLEPFAQHNPLELLRESLASHHPRATVMCEVSGYVDLARWGFTEQEFAAKLEQERTSDGVELKHVWRDASELVNHPLLSAAVRRIETRAADEAHRARLHHMLVDGLAEVLSAD